MRLRHFNANRSSAQNYQMIRRFVQSEKRFICQIDKVLQTGYLRNRWMKASLNHYTTRRDIKFPSLQSIGAQKSNQMHANREHQTVQNGPDCHWGQFLQSHVLSKKAPFDDAFVQAFAKHLFTHLSLTHLRFWPLRAKPLKEHSQSSDNTLPP